MVRTVPPGSLLAATIFLAVACLDCDLSERCYPSRRTVQCSGYGVVGEVEAPVGFELPRDLYLMEARNCLSLHDTCSVPQTFSVQASTPDLPDGQPRPDGHSLHVTVNLPAVEGSVTYTIPASLSTSFQVLASLDVALEPIQTVALNPIAGTLVAETSREALGAMFDMQLETANHLRFSLTGQAGVGGCMAVTEPAFCTYGD